MDAPDNFSDFKIRLGDFGEVERVREDATDEVQPYGYRAPEVILQRGWDSKIDIWNFAGLVSKDLLVWLLKVHKSNTLYKIWEIFERRRLWSGSIVPNGPYCYQGHLWNMVHNMGPAPPQIRELELGKLYFDEKGT